MATENNTKGLDRIYVHDDKYATLLCPKCGKSKTVDVSRYLKTKSRVNITFRFKCDACDCSTSDCEGCDKEDCERRHRHTVLLERRRFYRRSLNIPGICRVKWESPGIPVTIEDISVTGIQVAFWNPHNLAEGHQVIIEFTLPGGKSSKIARRVIVRTIEGLHVGVEYAQPLSEDEVGKAIRFFLMT